MAIAVNPAMEVTLKKKPPTKQRRVVVTGMGVETPLGSYPDVFYNNLLEGVSGISEIETFDCSQFQLYVIRITSSLLYKVGFCFILLLRVSITENCWRDQVILNRWMGCT